MLNNKLLSIFIVTSFCSFAQNKSVDAILKSQEIRKKHIDFSTSDTKNVSKSNYVNPFIGTGGHGHTYPGASAPFGMMQLSPDTRFEGWDGCSGYHYSDSIIYGFSHTHLSGTGVPDYCDLLIVPQNGKPKINPRYKDPNGFGSKFSHNQENASPGFYEVKLLDQQINVRLTVSERAGMHEYSFLNKKGKKNILIDLDHRDKLLNYSINILNKTTISGSRISSSWATNQHFYFYLNTNIPYEKGKLFIKKGQHKLLLTFNENTEKILIKVGISAVDEAGAKDNLEKEIIDWNFDFLRAETVRKWNAELNKINVKSTNEKVKSIFYTALYHTFIQPNIFSDVDGRYRGRDNKIHQITDNIPQYTVFSLWDTYRAANPLYTIVQPKRTNHFIHTFLRQFEQGGDLPVWELAGNETDCMIGYHSTSVIADAYTKNIRGFDAEKALKAMVFTSKIDELGKKQFREKGYISSGDEPESVSKTLEYAYNDFCIAKMATEMGKMDIYKEYYKSSLNFINLYDPQSKFMRARRDGMWYSPFEPSEVNFNYTEANSWQYSLYAPHAIDLLGEMIGGKDSLEHWLDRLFTTKSQLSGRDQADITGLIGQYAHGNEPSHHMAYLYNYTNAPYKTAEYVDKILTTLYSNNPDGLSGNEDCGQMSAWYVLSAMGLYQIAPGNAWYEFGRPMLDEVEIELENDNKFKIKSLNNSKENKYIQSITLNGKEWLTNAIHHSTVMAGGELIVEMGPNPSNKRISSAGSEVTKEIALNFQFTPSPFFILENRIFDDSTKIEIDHQKPLNWEEIKIEYRFLNDTSKTFNYTNPFTIFESSKIESRQISAINPRVIGAMPGTSFSYSPWVNASFIKRDKSIKLELKTEYANQYAASGPNTLIDGVQGTKEFRTGDWQGFFAKDLVTEVKFESPRILKEVGISCLQDMKSWIFYPLSIEIEISFDGVTFEKLAPINTLNTSASKVNSTETIPNFTDYVGPTIGEFYKQTNTLQPVSAIRIVAKNYGKCPSWHLGAGNDTWLFSDELIFR
jgi:predicted alpha-1,2-mannosidase